MNSRSLSFGSPGILVSYGAEAAGGLDVKVLVTGSSGLVGSALRPVLSDAGHQVYRLLRRPTEESGTTSWNPIDGSVETDAFDNVDAVVHLAGENIAAGRWTAARKARIQDSRVRDTRLLCERLAELQAPPLAHHDIHGI